MVLQGTDVREHDIVDAAGLQDAGERAKDPDMAVVPRLSKRVADQVAVQRAVGLFVFTDHNQDKYTIGTLIPLNGVFCRKTWAPYARVVCG